MHTTEHGRKWANATKNKFVRTFKDSVPFSVILSWKHQVENYGTLCVGRVDDDILCTLIIKQDTQTSKKRKRSDGHDETLSQKWTISNMFNRVFTKQPHNTHTDINAENILTQLTSRVDQKKCIKPSDEELRNASQMLISLNNLTDATGAPLPKNVEVSFNDIVLNGESKMIKCPPIILLISIPQGSALNVDSFQNALKIQTQSEQKPIDAILSCQRNPLSSKNTEDSHELTIAVSVPSG